MINNKIKNVRTCKGCNEKFIKSESDYIQIVKVGSECKFNIITNNNIENIEEMLNIIKSFNAFENNMQGKGKSIYIHLKPKCLDITIKKKRINGAIKKEVPMKYYEMLENLKNEKL